MFLRPLSSLILVVVASCGTQHDPGPDAPLEGGALQLNDVSVMFPLTAGPSAIASSYLGAGSSGSRGVLVPPGLYDAIGHIAGSSGNPPPGGTGEAAYGDLRVVAVRLDPCFASLAPDPHGAGCMNQVRVVLQEVTAVDGAATAFDSALHVFYRLDRDELVAFANEIAGLRAQSSDGGRLGALAPNPIMTSQGLDGAMATGVRDLVLKYAGAQNLIRATKFSASNADFTWTFAGFDVSDASAPTLTPMVIPTLPSAATSQVFFLGFTPDPQGQFTPATTSSDDLTSLANMQTAGQLTPAARQAAFDSLVRIDNPTHDSPNTIDCASCHLATPISRTIAPAFSLVESANANAFIADGVHVLPSEMTATFDAQGPFNLHAFSYHGTSPGINQRTVNETAAIVAYLSVAP